MVAARDFVANARAADLPFEETWLGAVASYLTEVGIAVGAEEHRCCDCVPTLGPAHCHACGDVAGVEVPWSTASCQPAAHERQVRAEAWSEGFRAGGNADHDPTWWPKNPYRTYQTKEGDRG